MRQILIEKNQDLEFDSASVARLKINSIVLPDLVINGTAILRYPLYMKAISGGLHNIEANVKPSRLMLSKGVMVIGSYIEHDELVIAIRGETRFPENFEAFDLYFTEKVQVMAVEPYESNAAFKEIQRNNEALAELPDSKPTKAARKPRPRKVNK